MSAALVESDFSILRDGFLRSGDRLQLYYRESVPPDVRGHVVVLHGVCEHLGRYRHLEPALNARGYGFHAMDLRGHGQSEGARADVDRLDRYLEDLDLFLAHVAREAVAPIFLFGHSLGGLLALLWLESRQAKLGGAVLSSAALARPPLPPLPVYLALRALSRMYPRLRVPALTSPEAISRSPGVIRDYLGDPLVSRTLTIGLGVGIVEAMQVALAGAHRLTLPVLVLHGGDDQLVDPSASIELYSRLSVRDRTIKLYPRLYHELLNEPERDTIVADVATWLDLH